MAKVSLVFFKDDCMGCHSCEVACKQEHGLGVGPRLVRVLERGCDFTPVYCHHCAAAPCAAVCPTAAISRTPQGVVQVDDDACIGCKACLDGCPFGAMQYDEEREVAAKCDLCVGRLARDQGPACATICPNRCIAWGDARAISERLNERA